MDIRMVDEAVMPQVWSIWVRSLHDHPEAFGAEYEWAKGVSAEQSRDLLQQIRVSGGFILAALEGETPIGMLSYSQQQGAKFRHKGDIGAVYVVPEQRGKGIAKMLLYAALEQVRKGTDFAVISLSVNNENRSAKQVYESCGFKVYGIEPKGLYVNGRYFDLAHMTIEVG
jgi:ribosomal protein S18 acetylase RimI-like enzyme